MKFYTVATLALVQASAIKLQYDVSEGPTKADNGENDHQVLGQDAKWLSDNWTNPLEWKDDGSGDEDVLAMLDTSEVVMTMTDGTLMSVAQAKPRRIVDADGDGVEDNVQKTREELDRFYIPMVFGPAEELHNTHHGNLPGHTRLEENEEEPFDAMDRYTNFADMTLHI